jgi:hypothetical protein
MSLIILKAVFDLSWEILKDIFPEGKVKRLPWEKPEVRHHTYKCKLSFDNMAEVQVRQKQDLWSQVLRCVCV